jgi:hypothetical protein
MHTDETSSQPEPTPRPARQRKAKIAAAVVGICLLAMGSSFAASLAFGAMGDHGPPGAAAASMPSECPEGPPSGMGPS